MPRLTDEEYESLIGPLERQNQKASLLAQKLNDWEKTSPAATWLSTLCQRLEIPAYYFGGVCRDIWNNKKPRDIDIVVDPLLWKYVEKEIIPFSPRKNSFGGTKMLLFGTEVDLWPLDQTWAFTQKLSAPSSPTTLPETTLLNIESCVAMVWHPEEKIIFQKGFFHAMETKVMEIQTIHKPFDIPLALARIERFLSLGWKEGHSIQAFRKAYPTPLAEINSARKKHYKD